ncbi:MAG: UDP-2-acetamido-2,6-beta-L-arabino-hexul-4-ose reductase [Caldimonas sp.]|uniref:UDP-2-acetamido-2,6-beta-L-arabino-hexul-4-ose reductase n=1 Tax=Caldimonas sp. TaxID=2838790 RepID=UPI00391974D3
MNIVITGAEGFIGRNLRQRLSELGQVKISPITRHSSAQDLARAIGDADFVFHLAGVNRPQDPSEFAAGNVGFTQLVCDAMAATGRPIPLVLASSTQASLDNAYGRSKREAEERVYAYGDRHGAPVWVFRLTNVFGKWCRPNYNSAVATFCHNIARGLPIQVNDPAAPLRLVYVDDVVQAFTALLSEPRPDAGLLEAGPVYDTTVGEVAGLVQAFAASRGTLMTERVGTGLVRALYSTYVSYLPTESFAYEVPRHGDARGVFVEMLKTPDCGQFSYFTAHPGVTRGEHYHHSKTEKFLVIRGKAHFGFRHILTNEMHEIVVEGGEGRIVETVPGWTHNITNIGSDELIVMLWANEVFDRARPDTITMKVKA